MAKPNPNQFLSVFFCLLAAAMAALVATSIYVQPLEGDLARMGGYAERDFGWNRPRQLLAAEVKLDYAYEHYHDVLVIGDSFSKSGLWQSFLRRDTGLSFATLHWDKVSVDALLANPAFLREPPKIVIAEFGIRSFPQRFTGSSGTGCAVPARSATALPSLPKGSPTPVAMVESRRRTESALADINLKFALLFLEKTSLRALFNHDFTPVKKYALTRQDLFSNRKSGELLVLESWFDRKEWSKEELDRAVCSAANLQAHIQSNGQTLLLLLPIPDKGSAYAKYIVKPEFASTAEIFQRLADSGLNTARADWLLREAIDRGEQDVYLPDDTHLGTRGYQLVAEALWGFLKKTWP